MYETKEQSDCLTFSFYPNFLLKKNSEFEYKYISLKIDDTKTDNFFSLRRCNYSKTISMIKT